MGKKLLVIGGGPQGQRLQPRRGDEILRYRRVENINIENNRLSGRNLESGLRSYKACLRLQHKGFENVKKIDGRMLWFCYDLKSENKRNED